MIIVTVDGHDIEFPDSMSQEEIADVLNAQRDAGQSARDKTLIDAINQSDARDELKLILDAMTAINESLSEEAEDRFPELLTELNSIKESIPELHADRVPDLLSAIESLKSALVVTVNAPEVSVTSAVVPAPIVNVSAPIIPAPIVNVDAPDMSDLTRVVSELQRPDFSRVEEILRSVKMAVDANRPEPTPVITGFRITRRDREGRADIITLIY